ncbi:hypothetical protein [Hyphococcus sp.]|uniref:hypothetical protein n=1 Tax=Hyphococcus sp. TaxID=2038636 RepID=UPI002084FA26|nr:MAG: hypothetical protein DHS20C04_04430 [Marinicaulis sp.]
MPIMLRSLAAVIIAVIAGFSAAKMIEGGGAVLIGAAPGSAAYELVLGAGWFIGAFLAALISMFIGKRWAPLGMLSASAILLGAIITLFSNPMSWFAWPVSFFATGLGGYGAIRFLDAGMAHPDLQRKDGLFDG